jgi:hypothetical protein
MMARGKYKNLLLTLTDDEDEVVGALKNFQEMTSKKD